MTDPIYPLTVRPDGRACDIYCAQHGLIAAGVAQGLDANITARQNLARCQHPQPVTAADMAPPERAHGRQIDDENCPERAS